MLDAEGIPRTVTFVILTKGTRFNSSAGIVCRRRSGQWRASGLGKLEDKMELQFRNMDRVGMIGNKMVMWILLGLVPRGKRKRFFA